MSEDNGSLLKDVHGNAPGVSAATTSQNPPATEIPSETEPSSDAQANEILKKDVHGNAPGVSEAATSKRTASSSTSQDHDSLLKDGRTDDGRKHIVIVGAGAAGMVSWSLGLARFVLY